MQPRQPGSPKLPTGVLYTLAVACAAGVATAGYVVLNRPLNDWRVDLAHKADLVREKLAAGPKLRVQHAEQTAQLESLLQRVEQVNRRVPDQPREGEFLADLSRLAEEHGVAILDFRRGQSTTTETHSLVTVTVSARGPHTGLCRLLDAIGRLPRLAELTHLEITGQAADGYPTQMSYALYYGMATSAPTASL